jgi:DNA modification methylase
MADLPDKNLLCYGDNLGFLSDPTFLPDESVDLIYLDPPFNSQQDYNVLFKEAAGTPEAAQIKAFEDTWKWDMQANLALSQIYNDRTVSPALVELMRTFMYFLKTSPMMAYLTQMAIRLVHMHRVLKPTGSLYLHCDPTASHYLKIVLDAIFGPACFQNEIVWKRTSARSDSHRWNHIHDVILFFSKSRRFTWNTQYIPYDETYLKDFYRQVEPDSGRRFTAGDLTAAGVRHGESGLPWKGIDPTAKGRHWAIPGYVREILGESEKLTVQAGLDRLEALGRILWPDKEGGVPRFKRYLDEMSGVAIQSIISDIPPISAQSAERMGYPTQKPVELLKRIILASSNRGDVILDPFCGCGTTIDAVEEINREGGRKRRRRWIGIDVTHIAINLIKNRLTRFAPPPEYEVVGEPASAAAAGVLAKEDAYQFQFWALGLIGARPAGGVRKKGADRGIDGVRFFVDEARAGQQVVKKMLVQVKGGHVKSGDIRDFVGTLTRESAEMGAFITLEAPSPAMRAEAASAGMYTSPWDQQAYPKVQIVTVAELLDDPHRPNPRCLQVPGGTSQHTLPEAPKHKAPPARQKKLGFDEGDET